MSATEKVRDSILFKTFSLQACSFQLFLDDARMKNFTSCFKGKLFSLSRILILDSLSFYIFNGSLSIEYMYYTALIFGIAEKQFLEFFFKRIKFNDTDRYAEDFPYLSLCGRERNFVRCDDQAIVYTHVLPSSNPEEPDRLSYGGTGELLTVPFTPEKICLLPWTGRIYHPTVERTGGIGLIKSSLAIELSKNFEFGPEGEYAPPTHFTWKDKRYTLTNELVDKVRKTDTED